MVENSNVVNTHVINIILYGPKSFNSITMATIITLQTFTNIQYGPSLLKANYRQPTNTPSHQNLLIYLAKILSTKFAVVVVVVIVVAVAAEIVVVVTVVAAATVVVVAAE
jgi:hypothetical protein